MALTNTTIKAARHKEKPYKLYDEKGLYLSIEPTGGRLWRWKYQWDGKEKKLAFGSFPEVGLKYARERRDEARSLLAAGVDPGQKKKADKRARVLQAANTFKAVAEEFIAKREREDLAAVTLAKARWLLNMLVPQIGARPIAQISAAELLAALRTVERRGNLETARRMRSFAGRVFRYGIATSRCERDLSVDIRDALTTPTVTHRAAILKPRAVG